MIIEKLEQLGLNKKEAAVYIASLELGESNINRISTKSKISRTTVYDIIDSLKLKGLIGSINKKKKKYYFATDPNFLNEKIDQERNTLKSILPELLSISNIIDKKPKIQFYEGAEGIKEIYLDTLKYPNDTIHAWVTDKVFSVFDEKDDEFINYYLKKRIEKKIIARVIAPNTELLRRYKNLDNQNIRQTKINTDNDFNIDVEIDLYANKKIGIMAFEERIGLIIESPKIFNTLKNIFNSMWKELN
jgi:sugar-specific transcriptional regulator TrmB